MKKDKSKIQNTKPKATNVGNRKPNRKNKLTAAEKKRIEIIKKGLGGLLFLTIMVFVFVYAIVGALSCPDGYRRARKTFKIITYTQNVLQIENHPESNENKLSNK